MYMYMYIYIYSPIRGCLCRGPSGSRKRIRFSRRRFWLPEPIPMDLFLWGLYVRFAYYSYRPILMGRFWLPEPIPMAYSYGRLFL